MKFHEECKNKADGNYERMPHYNQNIKKKYL